MGNPLPSMIGIMHTPFLEVPVDDSRHQVIVEWYDWAVRKVRLGLATYALNEHFDLCGIIETSGDGWRSNSAYEHLRDRVRGGDLAAILIHGDVSMERINRLAFDHGVRVYELSPVFPIKASAPWEALLEDQVSAEGDPAG